jgi:hypothetical protein
MRAAAPPADAAVALGAQRAVCRGMVKKGLPGVPLRLVTGAT